MDTMRSWDIEEIVAFMDRHAIRVKVEDGKTTLVNTKGKDSAVKSLMPHLRRRKNEVLAYYTGSDFYKAYERQATEAETAHAASELAAIRRVRDRAQSAGRKMYGLKPTGHIEQVKRMLPQETAYLCVEGEHEWEKLPLFIGDTCDTTPGA